MLRRFVSFFASCLFVASWAVAQPQLQELALTAIAGPAYNIEVQIPRVAVNAPLGFLFFEYDSVQQTLELRSHMQLPQFNYKMKFHPSLPLLYALFPDYSLGNLSNLIVVDLENIDNPGWFVPLDTEYGNIATFDVTQDCLYLYNELDDRLYIFDNSNPWGPELIASPYISYFGTEAMIEGQYLHGTTCMGMSFAGKYGLFDLTNIYDPILLQSDLFTLPHLLDVGGGHSVLESYYNSLATYQVLENYPYLIGPTFHSGKFSPARCAPDGDIFAQSLDGICRYHDSVWTVLGPDSVNDFQIEGSLLFTNEGGGGWTEGAKRATAVYLMDTVSVTLDSFPYPIYSVSSIAVTGNTAAVWASPNILFYDITNPADPESLSLFNTGGPLCISGNYCYVNTFFLLAIIDISDPASPQFAGSGYIALPPMGAWGGIVTNDTLLFVSGEHNLVVYDLADPENPQLVNNHYEPSFWYRQIHVQEGCLVATGYDSDKIYRADQNLTLLSTISPVNTSESPFIAGKSDTLILGDGYNFNVFSIADPSSPQLLQTIPFPGMNPGAYNATYDGSYFYANLHGYPRVDQDNAITIFSLSTGMPIELLDHFQIRENSYGNIMPANGAIFVTQGSCPGIYYYGEPYAVAPPISMPSTVLPHQFSFHLPHPNPFNPITTLTFTLPAPARVRLEVFDINGRAVGAHGCAPFGGGSTPALQFPAGTHQITFDGSDLPSGVYLARLTAGEWSAVQKMVMMK